MAFPEELDLAGAGSASHSSRVDLLFPLPGDAAVSALNALAEELAHQRTVLAAAQRRLTAQLAVTRVLAQADSLREAGPAILRALCEGLGWEMGAVWSIDPAAHRLRCGEIWHSSQIGNAEFAAKLRGMTFAPGSA